MNTPFDLDAETADRIVYVRPVEVAELPAELRAQSQGLETIYALHTPDGERLALVANRQMAFDLARHNDFSPVTVH